jgi:hypothetical protein
VTTRTDVRHIRTTARTPRQTTNPKDPQTVRGTAPAASRRVVLLATCLAGLFLAAWAPDALAHDTSTTKTKTVDKNFTVSPTSSCTGEIVNVEGTSVVQTETRVNGNRKKETFKIDQRGKGVGQVSSKQYRYLDIAQNTSVESTSTMCTFYVRITSRAHLIRQGNRPQINDDFFARSRLLIRKTTDCQTELTVESFDVAECK